MKKTNKKEQIKIEKIEYYPDAQVKCSCGAQFKVGSTMKDINVEVCSACHPYYTGTQKLVDTSGRVDKFKDRLAKREKMLKQNKSKAKDKSTKTKPRQKIKITDTDNISKKGK